MKFRTFTGFSTIVAAVLLVPLSLAQDAMPDKEQLSRVHGTSEFSPYAGRSFHTRVLFGDTHPALDRL